MEKRMERREKRRKREREKGEGGSEENSTPKIGFNLYIYRSKGK